MKPTKKICMILKIIGIIAAAIIASGSMVLTYLYVSSFYEEIMREKYFVNYYDILKLDGTSKEEIIQVYGEPKEVVPNNLKGNDLVYDDIIFRYAEFDERASIWIITGESLCFGPDKIGIGSTREQVIRANKYHIPIAECAIGEGYVDKQYCYNVYYSYDEKDRVVEIMVCW